MPAALLPNGTKTWDRVTGKAVYRSVVKLARERQAAMVRGLGDDEVTVFVKTLERIIEQLCAESEIGSFP